MTADELLKRAAACETCGKEHKYRRVAPNRGSWAADDGHTYNSPFNVNDIARLRALMTGRYENPWALPPETGPFRCPDRCVIPRFHVQLKTRNNELPKGPQHHRSDSLPGGTTAARRRYDPVSDGCPAGFGVLEPQSDLANGPAGISVGDGKRVADPSRGAAPLSLDEVTARVLGERYGHRCDQRYVLILRRLAHHVEVFQLEGPEAKRACLQGWDS